MTEKFVTYGIVIFAVTVIYGYLNRGAKTEIPQTNNGHFVLRMNKLYGIISVIGILLGLLIAIMIITTNAPFIIAFIVLAIFLVTGIPLIMIYKNHYLKFDNNIIEVQNYIGKVQSLEWKKIRNISFNYFTGFISITDNYGTRIKVHYHLVGFSSFIRTMEAETNWTEEQLKLPN